MVTRDQQPCSAHRGIVAATFLAWMSFTKQGTAWDLSCIGIGFVGILGIVFSLGLFTSAVMGSTSVVLGRGNQNRTEDMGEIG